MQTKMFSINKNAIISGDIDYYCFVCDYQIKNINDVETHVEEGTHVKNLEATPYLSTFPDEYIRKFECGYYCAFCNILISSENEVKWHLIGLKHQQNKGSLLLNRTDDTVLVFNDYAVSEKVWNGIEGLKCLICNIEFEKYVQHKIDVSHILNLIQNRVQFGVNNTIYRKMTNNGLIHCLTCNKVIKNVDLKKHFNDDHSMKSEAGKSIDEDNGNVEFGNHDKPETLVQKNVVDETASSEKQPMKNQPPAIEEGTNSNQANDVDKTLEKRKAVIPSTNVNLDSSKKSENKQIEQNDDMKLHGPFDVQTEAKAFAKTHNITYNCENGNASCLVCETRIPYTLQSMKEHVAGRPHKRNYEKFKTPIDLPMKSEYKSLYAKRKLNYFGSIVESARADKMIINEAVCMDVASFNIISKIKDDTYRCHLCEVNLSEISSHQNSRAHMKKMLEIPVLIDIFPSEFVREVRPGIYHCGFCNQLEADLGSLQNHFQCIEHKKIKRLNERCLERLLPGLQMFMTAPTLFQLNPFAHIFLSRLFNNF